MRVNVLIAVMSAALAATTARAEDAAPAAQPPASQSGVTVNLGALPAAPPHHKPTPRALPFPRPKPDANQLAATGSDTTAPTASGKVVPMPRPKPDRAFAQSHKGPKAPELGSEALPAPATPMTSPQGATAVAEQLRGATMAAEPTKPAPDPTAGFSVLTRVQFPTGKAALGDDSKATLDTLAHRLLSNDERVRLAGFSGAPGDMSSDARRLSLQRALAVRSYLVTKGVPVTRVDVLAFGGSKTGSPDRVDILVRKI